ncbi:MAG: head-tail adaptor protein [Erysipelotrichaceae bacterium]|nr:head-tail adaptor protein [Erysipelotrichaceae bacterium]
MANIGGNIIGTIYTKNSSGKNAIGEAVVTWNDVYSTVGWLGYQTGDSKRSSFSAKLEETTHVFLCDFVRAIYALADQDTRMKIKGVMYDVLLIDNPDEMDEQLEIYLRKVGAWDGSQV